MSTFLIKSRLQRRLFLCLISAAFMVVAVAVILFVLFVLPVPYIEPTVDLPGLSDLPVILP